MNDQDFDLLTDNWIPCIKADGTILTCSIRASLEQSAAIHAIEHESPLVLLSTLRLLLAFCYRVAYASGKPLSSFRNWQKVRDAWIDGVPANEIDQYLNECKCRDRFRLFDDKYPFYQVAGLTCQGDKQPEPAIRLAFEQSGGTPTSLWEHIPQLPTVEEAAVYLVCCQAFGASASNTSNAKVGALEYSPTGRTFAPAYAGCIVWLEGANLLETLLLNLVDYDMTETDLPVWEDPLSVHTLIARQPQKAKVGDLDKDGKQIKVGKKIGSYKAAVPTGPVQLFSWPSRAVLLTKPRKGRVEAIHFTQGVALSDFSVDPMKAYNREGKPISLQSDRSAWRDLHSLLGIQPKHNRTVLALSHAARCGIAAPRLNVAGIARGDEAAKILLWRHERMPVCAALLDNINLIERLGRLLENAERAASELYSRSKGIARFFRIPGGHEPSKNEWDDINKIVKDIDPRPAYWARLEKHFFDLLENLVGDWDANAADWKSDNQQKATRTWSDAIKQEAERALHESVRSLGTTARAISAIARVRLNFNDDDLKPQIPKKNVKNRKTKSAVKGGKKKMSLDDRQKSFIGYLLSLADKGKEDRGALADLRTGLGKEPGKMARVHKHVVPYLPDTPYEDRWYYIIATLFGLFPQHREEWRILPSGKKMRVRTLGKAFKPLAFPPNEKKKEGMEARFVALLNAHPDDVGDHLRHIVRLLESAKPPQPLDWFQLFKDLLQWDHPEGHVQLRWARDFYKSFHNSRDEESVLKSTAKEEE